MVISGNDSEIKAMFRAMRDMLNEIYGRVRQGWRGAMDDAISTNHSIGSPVGASVTPGVAICAEA